jgi:hypothetical protein
MSTGSDEDVSDEEEEAFEEESDIESDEDELPDDIPSLFGGLTSYYRNLVKNARQSFFTKKAEELKPHVQKELVRSIENEWNGVLSVPEPSNATFDFKVLRNLLDDTTEKPTTNLSLRERKLEQINAQQHADNWRYDLHESDDDSI